MKQTYQEAYEEAKKFLWIYAARAWSTIDLGEQPATDKDLIIAAADEIKKLENEKRNRTSK